MDIMVSSKYFPVISDSKKVEMISEGAGKIIGESIPAFARISQIAKNAATNTIVSN
jgi:hypothetical protein